MSERARHSENRRELLTTRTDQVRSVRRKGRSAVFRGFRGVCLEISKVQDTLLYKFKNSITLFPYNLSNNEVKHIPKGTCILRWLLLSHVLRPLVSSDGLIISLTQESRTKTPENCFHFISDLGQIQFVSERLVLRIPRRHDVAFVVVLTSSF